jgi:hypothetical protein
MSIQIPLDSSEYSLTTHKLGRKELLILLGASSRLGRLLVLRVTLPSLSHDDIQHIVRSVQSAVRGRHQLVDNVAKQLEVSAGVAKDVGEEGRIVVKLSV